MTGFEEIKTRGCLMMSPLPWILGCDGKERKGKSSCSMEMR